jgi:hypothetical protein
MLKIIVLCMFLLASQSIFSKSVPTAPTACDGLNPQLDLISAVKLADSYMKGIKIYDYISVQQVKLSCDKNEFRWHVGIKTSKNSSGLTFIYVTMKGFARIGYKNIY